MNAIAIMGLINSALAASPDVVRLAAKFKDFIDAMFSAGVISKDDQDKLHAAVDERCAARLRGELLPHWQVEPDPTTPV